MSGEDGTTRNTEFSEPYYVKTGCFNASDTTKCTVNPSEYVRSSSGARGEVFFGGASYLILDSRIHKCYPWCFTPLFLCLSLSPLSALDALSRCPSSGTASTSPRGRPSMVMAVQMILFGHEKRSAPPTHKRARIVATPTSKAIPLGGARTRLLSHTS